MVEPRYLADVVTLTLNEEECNGCEMCIEACPYGAIVAFEGKIVKCDECNGNPVCIDFCTVDAIVYDEDNDEKLKAKQKLTELLQQMRVTSVNR